METTAVAAALAEPTRWGLSVGTVAEVAERLRAVWHRYRTGFRPQTRETSEHAWAYVRGLLTMDQERTFAHSARRVEGAGAGGQRIQHFLSASPWSAQAVLGQVRAEVAATALQAGRVLILDESADVKAAETSARAGRQDNGRLGQVEVSQVATFLALANEARRCWTWIAGELFLPERWFAPEMARLRQQLGIPPDCRFATTIERGWRMIQRVRAAGVPFEAVRCDELEGRPAPAVGGGARTWMQPVCSL